MIDLVRLGLSLSAEAEGGHHGASFAGLAIYLLIIITVIGVIMVSAKQEFGNRVFKKPFSQYLEHVYLFIENMCVGTIGSHGRKYVPMIMTLWLLIFVSNFIALFFPTAPTAELSFNLAMALVSVFYVQWEGIRANGLFGHFRHFAGPKLAIYLVPITAMIFVIEIISELMKNVSLSLRLFGNIHGGHQAVESMNNLGHVTVAGQEIMIPIGMFLMPIKLLTVVVQALIFCLLTCVYLSLVTHHEDDHSEPHAREGEGAAAAAH